MRLTLAALTLICIQAALYGATAYTAMQTLPPEWLGRIAMIAGRDGTPEPERWHFLLHDPASANGLREVVVSGGQKTADRTLSQFAEALTPGDVIAVDSMKVDSSQAAQIAREFGVANRLTVSAMHFELRKSGPDAVPLWTVTCLDVAGAEVGKVLISAARGTVIMHPGFAQEPADVAGLSAAARATPPPIAEDDDSPPASPTPATGSSSRPAKKTSTRRRSTPAPATPARANFFQRVFGGQKPQSPR